MEIKILKPRKALNKAFLKVKPIRTKIEYFKTNLIQLLDRINDNESEEFHKNLVSDFLKDTYYKKNHFINTKGRNDLVIHNGDKAASAVGVVIEAKKPTNKAEMLTKEKINVKAFQELVLYYLRERITQKNIELKHLIATNIKEWFIFDATLFDKLFAQNKTFVKHFEDFEGGRLADTKTDFFYKQKVVWYFLKSICVIRSGGYIEVKPQYFEQIPIPVINEKTHSKLTELAEKVIQEKSNNQQTDISTIENEIDQLIYQLYDLTAEEIAIIENSTK